MALAQGRGRAGVGLVVILVSSFLLTSARRHFSRSGEHAVDEPSRASQRGGGRRYTCMGRERSAGGLACHGETDFFCARRSRATSEKAAVPAKPPSDAELKAVLGKAGAVCRALSARSKEKFRAPRQGMEAVQERVRADLSASGNKKRTLLYLTPDKGQVLVAIVLGERAYKLAMARLASCCDQEIVCGSEALCGRAGNPLSGGFHERPSDDCEAGRDQDDTQMNKRGPRWLKRKKPASFVHLRVKSAYSLLEGAVRPKELADLARGNGMPAVAVTDVNNLFGRLRNLETLAKAVYSPSWGCLLGRGNGKGERAGIAQQTAYAAAAGAEMKPATVI